MYNVSFNVIMPCYNSQDYVKNALDSIVNQTYGNWKLIAVNDGSTDSTLSILNEYASKDNRIKILCKENGGYATAVNMALDHVDCDYFMMLGSDDALNTDLFKQISDNVSTLNALPDFIGFNTAMYTKDKEDPSLWLENANSFYLENTNFYDCSIKYPNESKCFAVRDTSRCYKTSLLTDLRYFGKTGIHSDGIFSLLFAHKCSSFYYFSFPGYLWNIREKSISSTNSLNKTIDELQNWTSYLSALLDKEVKLSKFDVLFISASTRSLYKVKNKSFKLVVRKSIRKFLKKKIKAIKKYDLHLEKLFILRLYILCPSSMLFFHKMRIKFRELFIFIKERFEYR